MGHILQSQNNRQNCPTCGNLEDTKFPKEPVSFCLFVCLFLSGLVWFQEWQSLFLTELQVTLWLSLRLRRFPSSMVNVSGGIFSCT